MVLERLATLEKTETCDSPDKLLDAVQGAPITKRQLYSVDDFSDDMITTNTMLFTCILMQAIHRINERQIRNWYGPQMKTFSIRTKIRMNSPWSSPSRLSPTCLMYLCRNLWINRIDPDLKPAVHRKEHSF